MTGTLPGAIAEALQSRLGFEVAGSRRLGGGSISESALVELSDGRRVFVKWNYQAPESFFGAEAAGLEELAKAEALKVPHVELFDDEPAEGPAFIVLESLEHGAQDAPALGRGLAALHRITDRHFGFNADNYIGRLPQLNGREKTWSEFFINRRLSPQIEFGQRSGWFDWSLETVLNSKMAKIKELLDSDPSPPSLLHGDLWSGNVFWSSSGPALIDPAVYYGSREADLAFSELFGGFGAAFYQAYNEEYPLDPGYQKRKELLNLYHLMNHANLFGGSYIGSSARVIRDL